MTTSTKSICDAIGRDVLADALGISLKAVSNASVGGRFPASWWLVLDDLCSTQKIHCPTSLFNFQFSPSFVGALLLGAANA